MQTVRVLVAKRPGMLSRAGPMAMTGGSGSGAGFGAQPGPQSSLSQQYFIAKLFARREEDSGGHVLCDTSSRGLCGLVCSSREIRPTSNPFHTPVLPQNTNFHYEIHQNMTFTTHFPSFFDIQTPNNTTVFLGTKTISRSSGLFCSTL